MTQYDLSVIIPARQEMFLAGTIEHLVQNIRGNTEIIAVLDGAWADPPVKQHKRVNVIYVNKSIGQRAATNLGVKLSKAKYVAKIDAHCTWDEGCDQKMIDFFKEVGDDVTAAPIMRNLWIFTWKCYKCGWNKYQGPTPVCPNCGPKKAHRMHRKMMWVGKNNPQSTSYSFDSEPHFQYNEAWKHREPYITDKKTKGYTETMSLQGSFFMCTREKYWELELCDEKLGNWGNQGIELACKTWLSGGRVLCNHKSWYAHLFRTSGGDFGFPYNQSGRDVQKTKRNVKNLFWENKWSKQVRSLSWLIEKFSPVSGWGKEELARIKRFDLSSNLSTFVTTPSSSSRMGTIKSVSSKTESFPTVSSGRSITSQNIISGQDKSKVSRITTVGNITKVVKDGNITSFPTGDRLDKPSVNKPVDIDSLMVKGNVSVPVIINGTSPQPAPSNPIKVNMGKDLSSFVGTNIGNSK